MPCWMIQILQYKFLDRKWPPPPFGTFPKIHPFWLAYPSLAGVLFMQRFIGANGDCFQCTKSNQMHNCAFHSTHSEHKCIAQRNFVTLSYCSLHNCTRKVESFCKCDCLAFIFLRTVNGCCKEGQIIWNDGAATGEILAHCKHCFRSEHTVNTRQCSG